MRYMLLIYGDEAAMRSAPADAVTKMSAAYASYTKAIREAGILLAGDPLQQTRSATSVRVGDGKTNVIDGPYADTKEQLGGYYMVDVPDIDAAISWAARCPGAATGTVEVRPVWEMTM
ncbi:YciI family protein [Mesorhizobium sp. 10J20-29]